MNRGYGLQLGTNNGFAIMAHVKPISSELQQTGELYLKAVFMPESTEEDLMLIADAVGVLLNSSHAELRTLGYTLNQTILRLYPPTQTDIDSLRDYLVDHPLPVMKWQLNS